MMSGSTKEYDKLKGQYQAYLAAYKQLNNGSTKGATGFSAFYIYKTFTNKYSDPRAISTMNYR